MTQRASSNPRDKKIGTVKDFENVRLDISPAKSFR